MYTLPRLQLPKYARIILLSALLWVFFFYSYAPLSFRSLANSNVHIDVYRSWWSSWWSLHILKTTRENDFFPPNIRDPKPREGKWVNLPGFRRGDGFAWERLGTWKRRCIRQRNLWRHQMFKAEEEGWVNVTGVLSGEWVQYTGDLGETSGHSKGWKVPTGLYWAINVTGNEGRVMLRVDEKASLEIEVEQEPDIMEESELGSYMVKAGVHRDMTLVREVAATITVQDESNSDGGWEMRVYGVHWPRSGALLMTTTSEKFAGIFGLPHLSIGYDGFTTSQKLLKATVEKTLEKAAGFGASNPWAANLGAKGGARRLLPHCEYVVYVQVHPRERAFFSGQPSGQNTNEMEREITCPYLYDAVPLRTPGLQMSPFIFSPDCGFILESKGPSAFLPPGKPPIVCKLESEP